MSPGTYTETLDFLGKRILLESEAGPDVTVIDGGRSGSVVMFASGETETSILDGFTIRNGSGTPVSTGGAEWLAGGGILCAGDASPTITNCAITQNNGTHGGGIVCFGDASPAMVSCTITENRASFGGGLYWATSSCATIRNCTIADNRASGSGGAIYWSCPFSLSIQDSILWGNSAPVAPEIHLDEGSIMATYSDLQGGWPGAGNIDEDPLFPGAGGYHLGAGSPCVDAGTPNPLHNDACLPPSQGSARNDMGAYGGPGTCAFLEYALELTASHAQGELHLDATVATPEPGTVAAVLVLWTPTVQVVPIWDVHVPAIYWPIRIPVSFPLPGIGWIAVVTALSTAEGIQATDLDWVFTG